MRKIASRTLITLLIAVFAMAILILSGRANSEGHGLERIAERWAHERLLAGDTETLIPFVTDGCSGGLSKNWRGYAKRFESFSNKFGASPPWESCCVIHDKLYHNAAGAQTASDSFTARLIADQQLRTCVADFEAGGSPTMANMMYVSVRLGGGPCSGLPWRWGFGYAPCQSKR